MTLSSKMPAIEPGRWPAVRLDRPLLGTGARRGQVRGCGTDRRLGGGHRRPVLGAQIHERAARAGRPPFGGAT